MRCKLPLFSIIVPTFDRPKQLKRCLIALSQLDYKKEDFEVIVVDDGGTAQIQGLVDSFSGAVHLTLFRQGNFGPARARNTGALQAQGRFLAFTDDDCIPGANWLQILQKCFSLSPDSAIAGRTLNALPGNPFSTVSQMVVDYLSSRYNIRVQDAGFFTSNNLAVPARIFHTLGGFDETFTRAGGEDREFCYRWRRLGYHISHVLEATVRHAHPLTLTSFCRQHFNYGRGAYQCLCRRSFRDSNKKPFEDLPFYLKLLSYPLYQPSGKNKPLLLVLCLISQIATAAGLLWERFSAKS